MQLIRVPLDMVERAWPHVRDYLHRACRRGGGLSFADLEASIRNGERTLWVVSDGRAIVAAVATELFECEWSRACVINACGGRNMRSWIHLLANIEEYARGCGCDTIRVIGRKGWVKMLPRYRTTRVILDKRL